MQQLREEQSEWPAWVATNARVTDKVRSGVATLTKEHQFGSQRAKQSAEVGTTSPEHVKHLQQSVLDAVRQYFVCEQTGLTAQAEASEFFSGQLRQRVSLPFTRFVLQQCEMM